MSRYRPYLRRLAVGAAAVGIGVSACSQGGSEGGGTTRQDAVDLVSLEAANTPGSSPWTESVTSADPPQQVNRVETPDASRTVSGDQIGLYGGSTNRVVCDREKLIGFLETNPAKAAAWRSVTGGGDLRSYILGLSPVFLTKDTRLTTHGFEDGAAIPSQSVLQTGTAVLVDNRGLPRVRCDSGSPLDVPRGELTADDLEGRGWPNFDVESIVDVQPSQEAVEDLKVIPVAVEGDWAPPPMQTTAPLQELVLSVVLGDATAVLEPDVSLPPGLQVETVEVASTSVTTTAVTTATTTVQTTTDATTTTTVISTPTPTTDPVITEPTDTGTVIEPEVPVGEGPIVDDPGTVYLEPTY